MKYQIIIIVSCVLSAIYASESDRYFFEDSCNPLLAEDCFTDVHKNLKCHLSTGSYHPVPVTVPSGCQGKNAKDLCSSITDALGCAADEIDTSCNVTEGVTIFDVWLQGLRTAANVLCKEGNIKVLQGLLDNPSCWNLNNFFDCIQDGAGIQHLKTLLTLPPDQQECKRLEIASTICIEQGSSKEPDCHNPIGLLSDVMYQYFNVAKCGYSTTLTVDRHRTAVSQSAAQKTAVSVLAVTVCASLHLMFKFRV